MKLPFLLLVYFLLITSLFGQSCHSVYFDGQNEGLELQLPIIDKQPFGYEFENEFTFDFWIKTQHPTFQDGTILNFSGHHTDMVCNNIKFDINSFGYLAISITVSNQTLEFFFSDNPINDGNWHHITFTRDSNNLLKLYVDYELNYTSNFPVMGLLNLSSDINCNNLYTHKNTIGYLFSNQPTNFFQGYLDNLRIWDMSFNQETIDQLMNKCVLENFEPILNLQFDELQNQSYIDFDNGFFTLDNFSSSSEEVPLCCDCSIDIDLTSVCKGDEINLVSYSNYEVVWPNNSNANSYSFIVESDTTFNVFFMDSGNIMCHDTVDILMLTPQTPIITDLGNSLLSSQSTFYQWYLNGLPIDNENSQIIQNVYNGEYNVFTIDKNGCGVFSDLYIIDMLETFDCINNECVNLGLGTGIYSNIESCQTNCQSSTYIIDEKINPRLTKVVNMFGQETGRIKNSLLFFLFDDGTVQKKYILTY